MFYGTDNPYAPPAYNDEASGIFRQYLTLIQLDISLWFVGSVSASAPWLAVICHFSLQRPPALLSDSLFGCFVMFVLPVFLWSSFYYGEDRAKHVLTHYLVSIHLYMAFSVVYWAVLVSVPFVR